jgi:hypothetical protein
MPASKRPTPEDTVTARRVLLDGLAHDADIFALVSELAPLYPRNNTFPGEVSARGYQELLALSTVPGPGVGSPGASSANSPPCRRQASFSCPVNPAE